jgi:hypothetical protein
LSVSVFRARLRIARMPVALRAHGPLDPDHFEHRFGAYLDPAPPAAAPPDQAEGAVSRPLPQPAAPPARPKGALSLPEPPPAAQPAPAPGALSLTMWLELLGKKLASDVPYPGVKAYVTPAGVKLLREGLSMWLNHDGHAEAFVCGLHRLPPPRFDEDAGPADTPLRILVNHALLGHERGALVHACGLIDRGRGVLVIGPGGAGKSTTAGLARPGQVLSDDQVALFAEPDGQFTLGATPFVGMYGQILPPTEVPLGALVVLDRREPGRLEPLGRAEALRAVLGCLPLYTRTPQTAAYALRLAEQLTRATPLWRGAPRLGRPLEGWLEGLWLLLSETLGRSGEQAFQRSSTPALSG